MDIEKAKKMARELRDHHKLYGWNIQFKEWTHGFSSGIIATTFCVSKRFEFSPKYFSINNEEFCEDQILHEIAHALAPRDKGHGELWKAKCIEIGAIPHELWEGYHSFKSPFGVFKAHRFEGDQNEKVL